MMNDSISLLRKMGVALAGAATLVAFCSCDDKDGSGAPGAAQPAATASAKSAAADALFEDLLFGSGKRLTASVTDRTFTRGIPSPECWNEMCTLLEKLEAYREELAKQAPASLKLARVSARVGQLRANLMSPKALEDYETALKDYNAMPDADKKSTEGKKLLCEIKEGMGAILITQKKAEDAFPHVKDALEAREALLFALVPKDAIPQISGAPSAEISEAATAYVLAASTMAVCKARMEDAAGARGTINACSEVMKTFPSLTFRMTLQYARLMATLGDLERVNGDPEAALRAWRTAAGLVAVVVQQNREAAQGSVTAAGYVLEAQSLYNSLAKAIKDTSDELVGEEGGEAAPEPAEPEETDLAPAPEPETPVVAPEPAPAAAPAPAPAPANNRGRGNRRH